MQWRAGLTIMKHVRQKERTVFLQKKSNYSKIGKLYRLCQIKEKVIGESAKYYEALSGKNSKTPPFFPVCFDEFQYQVETFFFASWRLIVHHTEEPRRKLKCPCWLGRSFWHCSIDFDRFCPHFGSFKTMLIFPIQDGIKVAAFGIVKLIPLHITW